MATRSTALSLVVTMLLAPALALAQNVRAEPGPAAFTAPPGAPGAPQFCPDRQDEDARWIIPHKEPRLVPNGFIEAPPPNGCYPGYYYFSIGALALQRERLSGAAIAVRDPVRGDTGIQPPRDSLSAVDFGSQSTPFNWGVEVSVGSTYEDQAIELRAFYLGEQVKTEGTTDLARLDVRFAGSPTPTGFEGNNNLWLQADRVIVVNGFEMASVEANYRTWWQHGLDVLVGFRYLDLRETFAIVTDDDTLTLRTPAPTSVADYRFGTISRIFAPQLGFNWHTDFLPGVGIDFTTKAAVGANFARVNHTLTRGDGFAGPGGTRNNIQASSVLELGLFSHWNFNQYIRFQAGYQVLWVVGVPTAHQQVNFDATRALGTEDNDGSMLFHGPRLELRISF